MSGRTTLPELADLWIEPSAIDPAGWLNVPLHRRGEASPFLRRRGMSYARLAPLPDVQIEPAIAQENLPEILSPEEGGQSLGRVIPADRVHRLPTERARITRLPMRPADTQVRSYLRFLQFSPRVARPRGRAAAWGLLMLWLAGTWGTFYGLTGGLKSHDKSKPVLNDSEKGR